MRISSKVLLPLFAIWLISVGFFYAGTNVFFMNTIDKLEQKHINLYIDRTKNAISQIFNTLNATNLDWAHWNDIYNFINGKNPAFIKENISPTVFNNINIDLIVILNKQGKIIYSGMLNPHQKIVPLPMNLSSYFNEKPIFNIEHSTHSVKTFINTPLGILFITANGVTNSESTAPINGTIIIGRFLQKDGIKSLEQLTGSNIYIIDMQEAKKDELLSNALNKALVTHQDSFYLTNNKITANGYLILKDLNNQPFALLDSNFYRFVSLSFHKGISYFIISSITIFVLSAFFIWYIIKLIIINRLEKMNKKIISIRQQKDYTQHIIDRYHDELSSFSNEFNTLIDKFNLSQHELLNANQLITASETRFRHSFDFAPIGMALVSPAGRWLKVNKPLCDLLGYSESELLQLDFKTVTHPDDLETSLNFYNKTLSGKIEKYQLQKRYIRKNGKEIWALLNVSLVRDPNTNEPLYFIAQLQDVNEQKHMEKKLLEIAYHDLLTGLANRKLLDISFTVSLNYAERYQKNLAICFLDLDFFKNINDQYGHETGDRLLRMVADRIKKLLRATDIIARLGGDEFIIVLTEISDIDSVESIMNKIQLAMSEPFHINSCDIKISFSIGISIYPEHGTTLKKLLNNADKALYMIKNSGRNNYRIFSR